MEEPRKRLDDIDPALNQLTEATIGAAIAVHRELGAGYLENVYQEAMAIELNARNIPFVPQYAVGVRYRGQLVGEGKLDFFVDRRLVVELKTVDFLVDIHTAQVLSYLKATHCKLGLLINFNVTVLKKGVRRVILS
jgi:GxxExxY protein